MSVPPSSPEERNCNKGREKTLLDGVVKVSTIFVVAFIACRQTESKVFITILL